MGASCCKPEVRPFPLRFACPRTLRLAPWPARASERARASAFARKPSPAFSVRRSSSRGLAVP